jgi:membrane peptidoglycan carboxypeptidase
VVYRAPGGKRVLTPQVARTVTDVLSHVTEGTAPKAKLPDERPLAGKTGTRDNSEDAWFAGYTPQLAAVVWMGDPASSLHAMTNVGGIRVFGGTYPAITWQKFMATALAGQPIIPFTAPDESLWPSATRVNPGGGRGSLEDFTRALSPGTSTLPTDSTTTTTGPATPPATQPTTGTSVP